MIVIDDHNLFLVLAGVAGGDIGPQLQAGEVFTTSSWYYRLARAARDLHFAGALSERLGALPAVERGRVERWLDDLPPDIGILPARVVVPVMAALGEIGRFN